MDIIKAIKQILPAAALTVVASAPHAATIDLTGIGFVQYGDAQSYSLPIAMIQSGLPQNPSNPFYIASGPGQIQDLVVVATGSNGGPVNTNFAGMDNAYSSPNGQTQAVNFYQTGGLNFGGNQYGGADPGQVSAFTGDAVNRWDATLASLKTFLNGQQMVVFFNNNQDNSLGTASQSLAVWARVTLTNNLGSVIGTYDLTNNLSPYNLITQGGGGTFLGNVGTYNANAANPTGAPRVSALNGNTDYVLSGGAICVNTAGPIPVPVPCGSPGASAPINHNLGANQAAYAILFPELNAQMAALFASLTDLQLADYTMHVDFRMGCDPSLFGTNVNSEVCSGQALGWGKNLTNGFEQIFIGAAVNPPTQVPLPGTLALLGLGLLGLGFSAKLRKS